MMIMLLSGVFPLAAQHRLEGVWAMCVEETENTGEVSLVMAGTDSLVIRPDGTCLLQSAATVLITLVDREVEPMTVWINASAPGRWVCSDERLTIRPDKKKASVTVSDNGVPGIVRMLLVAPLKKELSREIKRDGTLRILSLTETELVIVDEKAGPDEKPDRYQRVR